jgi:hypothetical protein
MITERDSALQLLRIVEAYQAIQRRIERVGKNSNELPKLAKALKTLDGYGTVTRKPRLDRGRSSKIIDATGRNGGSSRSRSRSAGSFVSSHDFSQPVIGRLDFTRSLHNVVLHIG